MTDEPRSTLSAGWWWARCNWSGDLEVVHVKANYRNDGFDVAISGTDEPYDEKKLIRGYKLISRIAEPE